MTEQTENKQRLPLLLVGILLLIMGFMLGRATADRYEVFKITDDNPYLFDKATGKTYIRGNGLNWIKLMDSP